MIRLHHVNLTSLDVPRMRRFYQDALGLEDQNDFLKNLSVGTDLDGNPLGGDANDGAYNLPVAVLEAGDPELLHVHLATIDNDLAAKLGHSVNPLTARGHIAFRTDDLAAIKARLDKAGITYSHYGPWAFSQPGSGWRWDQIFFNDPVGNVIEVHQVID